MKKIIITILSVWLGHWLAAQNIVKGEYFFDLKKDYGQGTPITIQSPGSNLTLDFNIPVDTLPEGLHRLFVRFRDSGGRWGQTMNYNVLIKRDEVVNIVAGEYFFDAVGDYGTGISLTLSSQSSMSEVLQGLSVGNMPDGLHRLFVRFKDSNRLWSQTMNFNVFVKHQKITVITGGEYFFDTKVEYGQGNPIVVDSLAAITTASSPITIPSGLSPGQHTLYFRFKDSQGLWSHTFEEPVCANVVSGYYQTDAFDYCFGDTVFFSYAGSPSANATYNWDLDNDGSYDDWQSNGTGFFYVPNLVTNDSAVFKYRITSPTLCPGWNKIDSLKVRMAPAMSVGQAITNASCFGECDGAISLSIGGGTAPFTFLWENGSTNKDRANLCAGDYKVTVTDMLGCMALDSFTVAGPTALDTTVTTNGQSLLSNASGIDYQWLDCNDNFAAIPGAVLQEFFPNEDGVYAVEISDGNCSDTSGCHPITLVGTTEWLQGRVKIFPNPASNTVQIELPESSGNIRLRLFDILGRPLQEKAFTKTTFSFDLTLVPNGAYNLILESENGWTGVFHLAIVK
ncbi:MAG: T9SS type A sorting domain-containing protein [Lewinellaceae bacterium]|nr:T9SS type A sorting domain-containing protein [Saprospiraceae bacterium]MCB9339642.1 T9SS type A sorting domain-containing protein [Lewinellaceae bacterium]